MSNFCDYYMEKLQREILTLNKAPESNLEVNSFRDLLIGEVSFKGSELDLTLRVRNCPEIIRVRSTWLSPIGLSSPMTKVMESFKDSLLQFGVNGIAPEDFIEVPEYLYDNIELSYAIRLYNETHWGSICEPHSYSYRQVARLKIRNEIQSREEKQHYDPIEKRPGDINYNAFIEKESREPLDLTRSKNEVRHSRRDYY